MADFIQNLYVPSGTGRPGVLTNVQLAEVEPDLGRRASNFVPYSSLYHTVYPQRRRTRTLYKWSVVVALLLLIGVVVMAALLLGWKNTFSPAGGPPSNRTRVGSPTIPTNFSSTLSSKQGFHNTSGNEGTTDITVGNTLQDKEELLNFTDTLVSKDFPCSE